MAKEKLSLEENKIYGILAALRLRGDSRLSKFGKKDVERVVRQHPEVSAKKLKGQLEAEILLARVADSLDKSVPPMPSRLKRKITKALRSMSL